MRAFRNLPQWARLEPSSVLRDVADFESMETPFVATFHVGGFHSRVLRKTPLFQVPGVDLSSWAIDLLHSWHYGPMSTYLAFTLRQLLATPVFRPGIAAAQIKKKLTNYAF